MKVLISVILLTLASALNDEVPSLTLHLIYCITHRKVSHIPNMGFCLGPKFSSQLPEHASRWISCSKLPQVWIDVWICSRLTSHPGCINTWLPILLGFHHNAEDVYSFLSTRNCVESIFCGNYMDKSWCISLTSRSSALVCKAEARDLTRPRASIDCTILNKAVYNPLYL